MSTNTRHHGVIVGVDGSSASHAAVRWAAHDAALRHVPLTLVHVLLMPMTLTWPEMVVAYEVVEERIDRHGRDVLERAGQVAQQSLSGSAVDVQIKMPTGNVVSTLSDMTKEAAMLVVGGQGENTGQQRHLGSVSQGVLHHAHCPVAVVRDIEVTAGSTAPVLVGIDGSPASEAATAVAFDEAARRDVGLIALHSWSDFGPYRIPTVDWEPHLEAGKEVLAERMAGWQECYPDVAVARRLVWGEPAYTLAAASEEAQLLVVGSHGRGGFAGMLLGSVSSTVVQVARVPSIVARVA
ncbi:MAG: universal stress protein [Mycobacterium sp.]|nr:universal stress protein [Mycobacterium sp.]MDZ7885969.1 universal stress protein [Mycobacterium sp.]